jgi:Metallo-peptidase family M12
MADQAAADAGVNLSAYGRRLYGFPKTTACAWWGLGSVGGNPSRAWINGDYQLMVVGHELGHSFGAYHSHNSSCDANGCTNGEYGDDRDIMGSVRTSHQHDGLGTNMAQPAT